MGQSGMCLVDGSPSDLDYDDYPSPPHPKIRLELYNQGSAYIRLIIIHASILVFLNTFLFFLPVN